MNASDTPITCLYAARGACQGPAKYQVVYRRRKKPGTALDIERPYCFLHALEHVDRAYAAGSIAQVDFELIPIERETA